MSFTYYSAGVYRQKYAVLAKFYDNGEARLFADVVDRDHVDAPIDAYLIMINPGSCKILGNESSLLKNSNYYKGLDVVEAVSDPAQKCVMDEMKWYCNELDMPLPQGFPEIMSNEEMKKWIECWDEFDPCLDI